MLFSLREQGGTLSVLLVILSQLASAVRLVTNSSIPANLTQSCATALLNDVNCSPVLTALRIGSYYPESTLNSTCTPQCTAALSSYQSAVVQACGEETWLGFEDTVMPLVVIPDIISYLYNLTCLMDTGRYCNTVAAKAAFAEDPGSMEPSPWPSLNLYPRFWHDKLDRTRGQAPAIANGMPMADC